MAGKGFLPGRFFGRLDVRILALLSLALLPLGVVAIYQTLEVVEGVQQESERNRLALTSEAVAIENELIERAFGGAHALSSLIELIRDDTDACRRYLHDYVERSGVFSFASYTNAEGLMRCSSSGDTVDVSNTPTFRQISETHQRMVRVNQNATYSKTSVVIISQPVLRGGVFDGVVSVSLPHFNISTIEAGNEKFDDAELLTFNRDGEVLTSRHRESDLPLLLPADRQLSSMASNRPQAFTALDGAGRTRIFAAVPVVEDTVYALGVWRRDNLTFDTYQFTVFPALMWLASLAVAYFAIHRLVIRHIRALQRRMRRFASESPPTQSSRALAGASREFAEMGETFDGMTERIIRDQADLENVLHERGVLLREVHHRVKNNLQLIVSIMNMEIRRSRTPEAKDALKRVQDRVLGLATIHRRLYQTEFLGRLSADELLEDIVRQMTAVAAVPGRALRISSDLEPVALAPDQAVPLSLLLTEALTNAIKYAGQPAKGEPWINVTLREVEADTVELMVENSCGPLATSAIGTDLAKENAPSGLGSQLMSAFAHQLSATVDRVEGDEVFRVSARFVLERPNPDAGPLP